MKLKNIKVVMKVIIKEGRGFDAHEYQEGIPLEVVNIGVGETPIGVYLADYSDYWWYSPKDLKKVKK